MVQLGSFKSETEARTIWKKLSKSKLFAHSKYHIAKADLGTRGVYYRLQAGMFKTEGEAKSFCKKAASENKKQGCFAVHSK